MTPIYPDQLTRARTLLEAAAKNLRDATEERLNLDPDTRDEINAARDRIGAAEYHLEQQPSAQRQS